MKNKVMKVLLCILGGYILGTTTLAYADMNTGRWEARAENRTWMSELRDDVRLSELSIPGTHDSATATYFGANYYVKTQSIDIRQQLDNGIRFLDARVRAIDGVFTMHHGNAYLNQNFGDVLNKTVSFLKANPNEVVYMRLKQEYSSVSDQTFNQILNNHYLQNNYWRPHIYYGNANPTLRETRGKIVILRNFSGNDVGIPYPSGFDIQDYWNPVNPNDKRWAVEQQLNKTSRSEGRNGVKYINYLSANGFWSGVTGYASVINPFTFNYILNRNVQHTGIVPMDYPSEKLVNAIIDLNHRLLKNPESKGRYHRYLTTIQSDANVWKIVDWNQGNNRGILFHNYGNNNQKWIFEYDQANRSYILRSLANQNYLLTENASYGIDVTNRPSTQNRARWRLIDAGRQVNGNIYYLQNIHSGRILEVQNGQYHDNQALITQPLSRTQRQRFVIHMEGMQ